MEKKFIIEEKVLLGLLDYIAAKPYSEVAQLLQSVQSGIKLYEEGGEQGDDQGPSLRTPKAAKGYEESVTADISKADIEAAKAAMQGDGMAQSEFSPEELDQITSQF